MSHATVAHWLFFVMCGEGRRVGGNIPIIRPQISRQDLVFCLVGILFLVDHSAMSYPKVFIPFVFLLLSSLLAGEDAVASSDRSDFQFYHTEGSRILGDDGTPAVLHGVAFGNEVWYDHRIPLKHHSQKDYERVSSMGMNLVRFYLNYKTLESDDEPYVYLDDGWAWIDQNIDWAREQGIYLILNIHVPHGGFQSLAKGGELWDVPVLQDRLVAMWKAIAERYRDEPVVFGYDLVNEPGVTKSKDQWQELAQRLCDSIREVDTTHPLIVERVNSVAGKWESDEDNNFFLISDDNVIYTFHYYEPFDYTHQYAYWMDWTKDKEGGAWHDGRFERSKAYLRQQLEQQSAWARKHEVPLYLGEWGLIQYCFEENRNGVAYVDDMLSLLDEFGWLNTYHTYHEDSFGIYRGGDVVDPENANDELIEVFRSHYSGE